MGCHQEVGSRGCRCFWDESTLLESHPLILDQSGYLFWTGFVYFGLFSSSFLVQMGLIVSRVDSRSTPTGHFMMDRETWLWQKFSSVLTWKSIGEEESGIHSLPCKWAMLFCSKVELQMSKGYASFKTGGPNVFLGVGLKFLGCRNTWATSMLVQTCSKCGTQQTSMLGTTR